MGTGERIRHERAVWGWTQDDLAAATGIDRTKITRIETGDRDVKADELARFAEVLQVPMERLVERPSVNRRVRADAPVSAAAEEWFRRRVDNSLFVRRLLNGVDAS